MSELNQLTEPAGRRPVPSSTYRLQITPDFGFADAAAVVDYLADLGISHVYLSPILQPVPGSTHGYDVVDHNQLNAEAGGREAFDALVTAAHARGLGVVVDVVPNHMALPAPAYLNRPLWRVLRDGRESPDAMWFDVDWAAGDDQLVLAILGGQLNEVLQSGELSLAKDGGPDGDETVVRYYEQELPVREGTTDLPLDELVSRQWWRLESWRAGASTLNYRRFFDVSSLLAVCVEIPDVFDASHALLTQLVRDGSVDGLRIDHPDGLADPTRYLQRLAAATDGAWVVVEKILEGDEQLPQDWACAGTTGYDMLWRIGALFVDPAGCEPLTDLLALTTGARHSIDEVVTASKQQIVRTVLVPEVLRLRRRVEDVCSSSASPWSPSPESVERALVTLLVSMDRYRAYLVPGQPVSSESLRVVDEAVDRARTRLDTADHASLDTIRDLVLGRVSQDLRREAGAALDDVVVRFQQTCGPVMAKGIEDTAFYRYHRLVGLNEVGGDPGHFAVSPEELMGFVDRIAATWPHTMTTLSTHDTKRSEDVRARLAVLSEDPTRWHSWIRQAQELARPYRSEVLDGATEYLLWQTLVGAWPLDETRLQAYATKAVREAKQHTGWTDPDEGYEAAVHAFVAGVLADPEVTSHISSWVDSTVHSARAVVLGQKLLQLVLPGVPDVYQGTEVVDLVLVDPDNRRPVDFEKRRVRLERLDAETTAQDLDDEKLLVTSRALRLRRDHPEWFVGERATVSRIRTGSDHAFAVARGDDTGDQAVAVVTRLAGSLESWGDAALALPLGTWTDLLTGQEVSSPGEVPLAPVLATLPVALLIRYEPTTAQGGETLD